MRSRNPVFSREGSFTHNDQYAGFGTQTAAQPGQQAYGSPYGQQPYGDPQAGQQPLTDEQLVVMYNAPSASPLQTGRMTMDDVVARTAITLLTLVGFGAAAWFVVPVENFFFNSLNTPNASRAIARSGGQGASIWAECDVKDRAAVAVQCHGGTLIPNRPDPGRGIERAGRNEAAIETECGRADTALVPGKRTEFIPVRSP